HSAAGHNIVERQRSRRELGQVDAEPFGEGRIEIDNPARRISRKEASRRMIEMIDRLLQFLKEALLLGTLVGNIGNLPRDERTFEFLPCLDWTRLDAIPDRCQ